jgi:hypothetical protein
VLGQCSIPSFLIFSKGGALNWCVWEIRDIAALRKTGTPLTIVVLFLHIHIHHPLTLNGSCATRRVGIHVGIHVDIHVGIHVLLMLWRRLLLFMI